MGTRKKALREMTAKNLGKVLKIFYQQPPTSEKKLGLFKIDYYFESLKLAYEYDGPEHYCEVGHIERDERKNQRCMEDGITLKRWPYYFQLTRDIAKYYFEESFSEDKFLEAISTVYKTTVETNVLAPGLHKSKNTPANFVHRGLERFYKEIDSAPTSLKSQVIHSLNLYRTRKGPNLEWLVIPEKNEAFMSFMKFQPEERYLNHIFSNQ